MPNTTEETYVELDEDRIAEIKETWGEYGEVTEIVPRIGKHYFTVYGYVRSRQNISTVLHDFRIAYSSPYPDQVSSRGIFMQVHAKKFVAD